MTPLEPGDSPGFLLWRVSLGWRRLMTATLKPHGLTHVQFVVLTSAWWWGTTHCTPPTQQQLAAHAGIDTMMTSQVLRVLEQRELLVRHADPTDARARRVTVTRHGAELASDCVQLVEAADADFFSGTLRRPLLTALRRLSERSA